MHDGGLVHLCNTLQDTIPQLLPGLDPNVSEERAGHFAKERLDNIEPGPVRGRMHVLKSIGPRRQVGAGFFGNMRGMVIQNDPYRRVRWILRVQVLEQRNELPAAMPPFDSRRDMARVQIQGRQDGARAQPFVLMVAGHGRMLARHGRQVGGGRGDR